MPDIGCINGISILIYVICLKLQNMFSSKALKFSSKDLVYIINFISKEKNNERKRHLLSKDKCQLTVNLKDRNIMD